MAKKPNSTQNRVQEIADELAQAAGRLREVLDEARPATNTDIQGVRAEIAALAKRVSALESKGAPARRAPAVKPTSPRRAAAAKPRGAATAASKVPAARAAAQRASKKRTST